ncbi:peptidase family s58 domain-containing protein [Hirsutella rhossiliensis]|uniref:Peptidase family s58 domain-containing protein n=1 Tax=Hirsutella rhossiliensis TaxID=111463 RepID=A0A9P8MP72_9HYPO|nr:peptidase family s58 domain-containing protein [Hirsutella rhossiliensis]KAH0958599.1 peptidase family s58 domain-containing protein [Hirsutella rhossiliensis]
MSPPGHKQSTRGRVRQVLPKLYLGKWPTGPLNSITDVPGVLAHTQSVQPDGDSQVNTGVTTILPRKDWFKYSSFAGVFRFNGCGEMTGAHWINETGVLCSPIIITATSSVGEGYRGVTEYFYDHHRNQDGDVDLFMFPLVAETYDGFLSDPGRFAITPQHVMEGIDKASADAVPEGNTGGGTGMICHRWKGGTGSSSRRIQGYDVDGREVTYTIGALVQANYGTKDNLRVGGIPVGQILEQQQGPEANGTAREPRKDGSIIIVLATDAPLLPIQLQRLATRATVGLAKVGGYGHNNSGDIFLAFSTGNKVPFQIMSPATPGSNVNPDYPQARAVQMTDNDTINRLFEASADAVEESIYNAMFMAETMTGFKGRTVEALDLDKVKEIVEKRL